MRALRLIALILWIVIWIPPVAIARALKKKHLRARLVSFAAAGMLRILRIYVRTVGELSASRPLLVVSNHLSYLDIPILASVGDFRFVPKSEIRRWPGINFLCSLLDSVYVDRSVGKIHEGNHALRQVLASGEAVALFPEATTGDGKRLLPFKPAFFESAQGIPVQPVAIAYRKIRGLPIDYGQWPLVAWYGDMLLVPHLWQLLSLGKIEVEVHFLSVIESESKTRKELAIQSHDTVSAVLPASGEPAILDKN